LTDFVTSEKKRLAKKAWHAANRDQVRLYNAERREHAKQLRAARHAADPSKRREQYLKYRAANLEKEKARAAKYRAANKEKLKAIRDAYRAANPHRRALDNHARRARERQVSGKLSADIREKLFVLQKGKCACCRKPLGKNYHMDHIVPLALGGLNVNANIQLLRAQCNMQKQDKHPIDFMQGRGFLL
jgi:5-methylcytosine-specific restriction endonuclease McrA